MMLIGYARVSTEDQTLRLQHDALTDGGCEKLFREKLSGTDAGGCAAVDPALCRALQHGTAAQRDRVCDAGGHAGRTKGTDPRRAGPQAGARSTATSVTPSAGSLTDTVTMVLPGETEAGSAGKQPCRGIARRAHRDDDHGRGSPLSRSAPHPIGSIDPDALKIPARRAASTLPRSARSPVPAEPAQVRKRSRPL